MSTLAKKKLNRQSLLTSAHKGDLTENELLC